MTHQHESLSAVVDGEVKDDKILGALQNDAELAAKWQRYHLIRQGLRKEMPEMADFDISQQVAQALEQEPAIVAPKRKWQDLPLVSNVVPLVRQSGQFAIAATVAVAMVLGVQQLNQPEAEQPFNGGSPTALPGIQGGLSPVSLEQTRTVPRSDVMEQRRQINAYLNDHRHQLRIKSSEQTEKTQQVENEEQKSDSDGQPE